MKSEMNSSSDVLLKQIADYEKVLKWYAEKAEAAARYLKAKKFQAIDAVITELTLDCGMKARTVLGEYHD